MFAQSFSLETEKKNEGSFSFYDEKIQSFTVFVQFDGNIDTSQYSMHWAMQPKSNLSTVNTIYMQEVPSIPFPSGFLRIPLNDTFINSGNYQVAVRLVDRRTQKVVEEQKVIFQTLREPNDYYQVAELNNNTNYLDEHLVDISKTFVVQYDLERLKKNILSLNPICDKTEVRLIFELMQNEKMENLQRFFYNFWFKRNPLNAEQEWKAYAEKLNFVAKRFASGSYPGYQTDRGKIYLKYGEPNRKINASNERGTRPYEVWFYTQMDLMNNVNLLFVQMGKMANDRVLIHSSSPQFFYNPNWQELVFTDANEVQNKLTHKVYEFFK